MRQWRFLIEHSGPSFVGVARLLCHAPVFALKLLWKRARYFATRTMGRPLVTPERFRIDTPDTLIAYWSMFVEFELCDVRWVEGLRQDPSPWVLDVGANAGVFSHLIHTLNPKVEIVCFEPLPAMRERIKTMAQTTGMHLTCHPFAVSDRRGEAWFESPLGHEGTSKIAVEPSRSPQAFRVQTITLDEIVPDRPVTLIKIDVEGFECEVLKGASRTLQNTRFLILEAQTRDHLDRVVAILGSEWKCTPLGSSDYFFCR